MARYFLILFGMSLFVFASCNKDEDDNDDSEDDTVTVLYKDHMRDFVMGISSYSKSINSNFAVIPQNGIELASSTGEDDGGPHVSYLDAIDGNGQEDLFYGYDEDDIATPSLDNSYLRTLLDLSKNHGNTILVTDYCSTESKMDNSYLVNENNGYISFAADQRDLNNIPAYPAVIHNENSNDITELSEAQNFLYLINPENYDFFSPYMNDILETNYDVIIIDHFFHNVELTADQIDLLKVKANGGTRLVIAYMSIGEAEDYRYYWQPSWGISPPTWMEGENPDWAGNYKVRYWEEEWQNIIYGNDSSYLKKILDANFDGVYLDIIDAFEYFE